MKTHPDMSALIPWYVNDTLDERQCKHLERHLAQCPLCRDELESEREIHRAMTVDPGVEYMPAPSLRRLQARLDALESSESDGVGVEVPQAARPGREMPWKWLAAASMVAIAILVGSFTMDRPQSRAPHGYYTVTTPVSLAPNEVIRAVFMPSITLVELQSVLDESQLRIVAGPTEAGVYSLAANSSRPVSESLNLLRRHESVRFAESTRPLAATDSPR